MVRGLIMLKTTLPNLTWIKPSGARPCHHVFLSPCENCLTDKFNHTRASEI